MRTLLFILLLANLLFFGWAHWVDTPLPGAHISSPLRTLPLASNSEAASANADSAGSAVSAAGGSGVRCAALGPLADAASVGALRTALQARNLQPRDRQAATPVTEGYWVYIDKVGDAAQRAKVLRRLARAGVHDAAALADSGQVSVGLFNEKAGADKRAAAVRSAGFEPAIEARTHAVNQYWLDVSLASDVPLPAVTALVAGLNLETVPQWGACP